MKVEELMKEWSSQSDLEPMTRTEYEFAEFLILNHEIVGRIGGLSKIFSSVRKWIKTNPESLKNS